MSKVLIAIVTAIMVILAVFYCLESNESKKSKFHFICGIAWGIEIGLFLSVIF